MARPSLADAIDLLDLVRETEDSARVSLEAPPPSTEPEPEPAPPSEEFVDVGDEAIDVAPSSPPSKLLSMKVATLPKVKPIPLAPARPSFTPEEQSAMPPVIGIVLVLGLAIGSLYAILALR
jgi:hypothetical protein